MLFKVEVNLIGTAYIRAKSETEAKVKAKAIRGEIISGESIGGDVCISSRYLDDPQLPEISLSPVMKIYSIDRRTLGAAS